MDSHLGKILSLTKLKKVILKKFTYTVITYHVRKLMIEFKFNEYNLIFGT